MKWPEIRLSEIAEFRNGLNYTKENEGSGLRIINVKDFGERFFPEYDDLGELNPDGIMREAALLRDGDIVFVRSNGNKDLVGRSLYIDKPPDNVSFSAFCIRVRLSDSVVPRFFSYFFRTPDFRKRLTLLGKGTNISNLNQEVLKNLRVPIPTKEEQTKLVGVIALYDDLIENNRRRMALLEQSAKLLYQEWFVRLRFPGHEHTRIIDGVPEGWEKKTALEVMEVLSGGTPKTTNPDFWDGEIPFYTPKDATETTWAILTERSITELGLNNCNSRLYPKGTVFISARGTVGKVNMAQQPMAMSQSCYALVGKENIPQVFVLCAMQAAVDSLRQQAVGAVFDAIIVDTFKRIFLVIPGVRLLRLFDEIARPIFAQVENLALQNQKLRTARDLLLPKLMSGEIAV